MPKADAKINCPMFQKQELAMEDITAKINNAKNILEKAEFAEKLQEEVDVILCCPDYNDENTDCSNCHFIANMRKKTAYLVIKARKLM